MQEMKEKELKYIGNGDANSHVCKVCFESPTATILLPCRHFCRESLPNLSGLYSLKSTSLSLPSITCILLQYVNLVRLLVRSVQYAAQILQIGFLLLPHEA